MANKKYKLTDGNYWATDGVYDFDQGKTQREVNGDLIGAINAITPFDTTPTANSTKGVTSNALFNLFKLLGCELKYYAGTGYATAKFSNGLLVTWGRISGLSFQNQQVLEGTINLPIAYKSTGYMTCMASGFNTSVNNYLFRVGISPTGTQTVGFTLGSEVAITINNRGFNFLVIGYWDDSNVERV